MLMAVKKNIKYFLQAIKVSIMSAMEYKVSFVIQTIFMFINNGFFLVFWLVVFNIGGDNMKDITFKTILYLWSIPTIAYGVSHFFFGGVKNINSFIITGQMDSYLLQPKHPLINVLTSSCDFSAFGDLLYGIVTGFIASGGNMGEFGLILLFGILGSTLFLATEILIRSISVWISDTEKLASRYQDTLLINFSTYPEQIFGVGLKVLLYTVIPVAYMAYIPIKLVLSFDILTFLIVLTVELLWLGIAIFVFNKAMKSYESGNSISMKM